MTLTLSHSKTFEPTFRRGDILRDITVEFMVELDVHLVIGFFGLLSGSLRSLGILINLGVLSTVSRICNYSFIEHNVLISNIDTIYLYLDEAENA